ICFFFFQAEDGIRYWSVTGVQTCALPISGASLALAAIGGVSTSAAPPQTANLPNEVRDVVITSSSLSSLETITPTGLQNTLPFEIGRASCRERGESWGVCRA